MCKDVLGRRWPSVQFRLVAASSSKSDVSAVTFVLNTFTLTPRDWQHHNGDICMGSLRCNDYWFGQYLIIQDEPQPWAMQMLR
jgi:hypothetical protein